MRVFLRALLIYLVPITVSIGAVVVDPSISKHRFHGFGAGVSVGDEALESAFTKLGISWVRMDMLMMDRCELDGASFGQFYRYIKQNVPAEALSEMGAILKRNRSKLILSSPGIPDAWLDDSKSLSADRVSDFANLWAASVRYALKSGLEPEYIELFDAPDLNEGGCSAERYSQVVKKVRARLDELEFTDVKICGPSLSQVSGDRLQNWVGAMDEGALEALDAWSVRAYEANSSMGVSDFRSAFRREVVEVLRERSSSALKPVLISDFATETAAFNSDRHSSPSQTYRNASAAQLSGWCIRVLENGLSVINEGAQVAICKQLSDGPDEETSFGLHARLEDGGEAQLLSSAFEGIFSVVPPGSNVVQTQQSRGSSSYATSFVDHDRLVVCITNRNTCNEWVELQINGSDRWNLVEHTLFYKGNLLDVDAGQSGRFEANQIEVPSEGYVTLVFDNANLVATSESVIHLDEPKQEVEGFGANTWIGDPGALAAMPELGMKWVRLNLEGVNDFNHKEMPSSEYVAYFNDKVGWDRLGYYWSIKKAQDLKIMMVSYGAPQIWCDSERSLLMEHAEDFALLWAASMKAFADKGYVPEYIELFNEPDGPWDTYCSPSVYNEVVKYVRRQLDQYGLEGIKIVGPGRAHADVGASDEWVDALDQDGLAAHDALSIHSWTWNGPDSHSTTYVRESTLGFLNSADQVDPDKKKLRVLTEFLSKDYVINDIQYGDHAKQFYDTAVHTVPYAVHVTEDLLSHLNNGFNTVIVWQLADQYWESAAWGLMGQMQDGYPRKPIFDAFKLLLPEIESGYRVLRTENASGVYTAAFSDGNRLVVAMVNSSLKRKVQSLRFVGGEGVLHLALLKQLSAKGVESNMIRLPVSEQWVSRLRANSVTVCVFELN